VLDPSPQLGPLPDGWEIRKTAGHQFFFIDHINQHTTWDDPRLAATAAMQPIKEGVHKQEVNETETGTGGGLRNAVRRATRMTTLKWAIRAVATFKEGILPPTIVDISPQIETIGHKVALGGTCDIYRGNMQGGRVIAIKRPRVMDLDEDILRRFNREAETWNRLRNSRILPLLGTYENEGYIHLVAPWAENGNAMSYIQGHHDLPFDFRRRLLQEIAEGLSYLHRKNLVHGDLKLVNVVLDSNLQALLCDFGLSKMFNANTSEAMKGSGTYRWTAPEILNDGSKSSAGDMYAYAMCIVEALTSDLPYPEVTATAAVILKVIHGERPPMKPDESPDGRSYQELWGIAQRCWSQYPANRARAQEAVKMLEKVQKTVG